eukprot:scaffold420933_cov19-Prasinocladus_malaysianus.AAC.1
MAVTAMVLAGESVQVRRPHRNQSPTSGTKSAAHLLRANATSAIPSIRATIDNANSSLLVASSPGVCR